MHLQPRLQRQPRQQRVLLHGRMGTVHASEPVPPVSWQARLAISVIGAAAMPAACFGSHDGPDSAAPAGRAGDFAPVVDGHQDDASAPKSRDAAPATESRAHGASAAGSPDAATCEAFLDISVVDQGYRNHPACSSCLFGMGASPGNACLPPTQECGPSVDCIRRHCTCLASQNPLLCVAEDYPDDVCACVDACLPREGECRSGWHRYMWCMVQACGNACASSST